ncbi:MAG: diaminopimelate decarboxylase [Trueperaceae bacterium]
MNDALLAHLAERFGTPTYVYDLAAIRQRAELLREVLPGAELLYAVKANSCGAVLRELADAGLGAEVITLGELERAQRAGVPAGQILVGGPGQDEPMIERALELEVGRVSLDSRSQWQLWGQLGLDWADPAGGSDRRRRPNFVVRINPQLDPLTHHHLATGTAESKFGMPVAEGLALAEELAGEGLLAGFHFHVGSQITSLEVYRALERIAGELFAARPEADTLDLGGGFAVPNFPLEQFGSLAAGLADRLGVKLLLEPGRYLVAEAGVLLTRVRHVKPGVVDHVIADAGMADLLRPALYGAAHPVRRVNSSAATSAARSAAAASRTETDEGPMDVDGPLCENADRLAARATLPLDLKRGDLLAVEQAGAYGMAMASNYASSLRPAEIVVDGDVIRLARARETVEDLLRFES